MKNILLRTGISSSSSWRVRICLSLKNIDYSAEWHDSSKALQGNISPMGQVPVLNIDGVELRQSVAICEYLEELQPTGLLPVDLYQRAKVREVVETINSGIQHCKFSCCCDDWRMKKSKENGFNILLSKVYMH